ncbi:PREDICTED: T-cell surface glycoprotein CD3 epsilon chain [Ceratotherium simum simum]|uniref:T-cell surface glycoprotein CD3 epsilon chain n=1 Tax=Ceratotherium simum simum TaxID=73337 RepID=A0ABM1CM20_CERSS|nr:PREDICTED: T-cell surface glycoprotein CD3 epsilon chain [Ceratotherium simum simum]
MQPGNLWRVLGLCLLSVGAWGEDVERPQEGKEETYEVSIYGTTVTLTCPEDVEGDILWEKKDGQLPSATNNPQILEKFSEVEGSGYYICYAKGSEKNHYLYLKARVCENCMEVDLMVVATIIIVDVCVTLGLLLLVYYWSKNKKTKAKPVTRGAGAGGRPRGQNKERPPPVPNPDYEPIRKGQRDLYAGLNQRGI